MVRLTLFCFLFLSSLAFSQKPVDLKKKFLGTYSGEVATFKLDTGEDLVDVDKSIIQVVIATDSVEIKIGRHALKGPYKVLFEAQKYYVLDCIIPGRLAGERIVVYKKGKKISRDGLYPQPSAMMEKIKD